METRLDRASMKIPPRIYISKTATDKLRNIKQLTKVNNNVLCRIAMMIAINSESTLKNAGVGDADGQEFTRDLLFGEHIDTYEIIIRQYMADNDVDLSFAVTIAALVEIGVHKFSHVRSLEQLCDVA